MNAGPFDMRQLKRWQIVWNVADNLDASLVEMPVSDHDRRADECQQHVGQADMKSCVDPAQQESNGDRSESDCKRYLIRLTDVRQCQPHALQEMVLTCASRRQSQQVFKLIEYQQNRSAERETDNHRV